MMKLFIGPCVLEDAVFADECAHALKEILAPFVASKSIDWHFKGSFDKANRTSIESFRGPGIEEGLKILSLLKKNIN